MKLLIKSFQKLLCFLLLLQIIFSIFSQDNSTNEDKSINTSKEEIVEEDTISELTKRKETILYGLETDIIDLLTTLISEKDSLLKDDIYDVFINTRNDTVKDKIIEYFIELKDLSLKDYVLESIMDPYDIPKSTMNLIFKYINEMKIKEAREYVIELIKNQNEDFFDKAVECIGIIGNSEDAIYLVDYLESEELTVQKKQVLMKSLGKLQAESTWDKLVEYANDEDENTYVRMYAAEAIGNMKKEESVSILADLFKASDPNLRAYVIKGLSNYETQEAQDVILEAFKDNHVKVRLEAIEAIKKHKIEKALPYILYRAKNDKEISVKYGCYDLLGLYENQESVDYIVSLINDKKINDTAKARICSVVIKNNKESCFEALFSLTNQVLKDEKKKNLRYAIGKEYAKYKNPKFENICLDYINSTDVATKGIGIDIFALNNFENVRSIIETISKDDKAGANKRKAKLVLEKLESQIE